MTLSKLIVSVVCLLVVAPTQAMYNADLGRWMERDPRGVVDGPSLYPYVHSKPLIGRDPTGLVCIGCAAEPPATRPGMETPPNWPTLDPAPIGYEPGTYIDAFKCCRDACENALSHGGIGEAAAGITICVDHNPVACICNGNINGQLPNLGITSSTLVEGFRNCIKWHELIHVPQVDCSTCQGCCDRLTFKNLSRACAECEAYGGTIECLLELWRQCGTDPVCAAQWDTLWRLQSRLHDCACLKCWGYSTDCVEGGCAGLFD